MLGNKQNKDFLSQFSIHFCEFSEEENEQVCRFRLRGNRSAKGGILEDHNRRLNYLVCNHQDDKYVGYSP